ncbi:MAG TPA: hypothetical protein VFW87_06380 [Pirellulales bacterium]|nr:hypothetical protein [Pirellulales bacterium]
MLVITPANLRKQWHQEIQEKFFLPCLILESRSYNDAIKRGQFRPFEVAGTVVICSYQFARAVFSALKARLKPICHRTLRRQVTTYVPYTLRHPLVQDFTPGESEDRLYTLRREVADLEEFRALALSITRNAKGQALLAPPTAPSTRPTAWAQRARRLSSPSRAARRSICCACWPTARTAKASCCSTARTPARSRRPSMPSGSSGMPAPTA